MHNYIFCLNIRKLLNLAELWIQWIKNRIKPENLRILQQQQNKQTMTEISNLFNTEQLSDLAQTLKKSSPQDKKFVREFVDVGKAALKNPNASVMRNIQISRVRSILEKNGLSSELTDEEIYKNYIRTQTKKPVNVHNQYAEFQSRMLRILSEQDDLDIHDNSETSGYLFAVIPSKKMILVANKAVREKKNQLRSICVFSLKEDQELEEQIENITVIVSLGGLCHAIWENKSASQALSKFPRIEKFLSESQKSVAKRLLEQIKGNADLGLADWLGYKTRLLQQANRGQYGFDRFESQLREILEDVNEYSRKWNIKIKKRQKYVMNSQAKKLKELMGTESESSEKTLKRKVEEEEPEVPQKKSKVDPVLQQQNETQEWTLETEKEGIQNTTKKRKLNRNYK